jgi:hypothetical protein
LIALHDFKSQVLNPLLRGEQPTVDVPLVLFAAEIDQPLRYIFEADRWDEVIGAGHRLASAVSKVRTVLNADGYTANDLLHSDGSSLLALVHDRAVAARWVESIERAVASETDIVTVSTLIHPVTVRQLTGGLYGTPRSVVGVPGVSDYQERINRYYGLSSRSTVPREDAVAQRRHFGEVVALSRSLMLRARESRQIYPFYEALPFAERCDSCRTRPAERLLDGSPVCGVCLRKRRDGGSQRGSSVSNSISNSISNDQPAGLVWIEAVGLERLLEQQRTPAAYRRLHSEIEETLHLAIPGNTAVLASGGWSLIALPASEALEAATAALEAISLHYGLRLPVPFMAAVAIGSAPYQFRALRELTQQIAAQLRRTAASTGTPGTAEAATCLLDVRVLRTDVAFDRFRRPYTIDEARRLIAGISILSEGTLPDDLFPDLAEQIARGSAGVYYVFERSKLPQRDQQLLIRLERAWGAEGAPGPRFYAMLSDALALAKLESG